ncbi:MAG TPA: YbaK/EbsC family protein [Acidimicrobiales bacterium]|nr:YbaK/EbsC family protein [Acidimicrobiales bacterium]
MESLGARAGAVAAELARRGVVTEVREMPASTRTAAEAADALGCEVAAIVKSLVFRAPGRDEPVLVLAPGDRRVDEERLAEVAGGRLERADPRFVKERTGFAIGGVPPLGHRVTCTTFLDERLLAHEVVWAAAGTPRSVFPVDPRILAEVTSARIVAVADDDP